jgi:uncharacterized protein YecE (DUF72 family)
MRAELRIGTSGWVYRHWQGLFYPAGLTGEQLLRFYSSRFDTVEVNYSFYRLPSRDVFAAWREASPEGFVFAVKASRYLTHMKKLRNPAEPLARLLASAEGLGPKLGPILFQFPHNWPRDVERLRAFLPLLPEGQRYAFEFRHPTWLAPEVYAALRQAGCALCIPDSPTLPQDRQVTAEFTYVRLHAGRSSARYSDDELTEWAGWLGRTVADGVAAYVYFNNDIAGYAVENARRLREMLGD